MISRMRAISACGRKFTSFSRHATNPQPRATARGRTRRRQGCAMGSGEACGGLMRRPHVSPTQASTGEAPPPLDLGPMDRSAGSNGELARNAVGRINGPQQTRRPNKARSSIRSSRQTHRNCARLSISFCADLRSASLPFESLAILNITSRPRLFLLHSRDRIQCAVHGTEITRHAHLLFMAEDGRPGHRLRCPRWAGHVRQD
jgi:hypothetical protein